MKENLAKCEVNSLCSHLFQLTNRLSMSDIRFLYQILNAIVNLAIKELSVVCIQYQLDFVAAFHLDSAI